jgi:hypothetical protein
MMPARTASGRSGQAATTAARSGSSGRARVAHWVARRGRIEAGRVGVWRIAGPTPSVLC